MSLEEANDILTMQLDYSPEGWQWRINTHTPYRYILGYDRHPTPDGATDELKQFLRYFTPKVLDSGDSIRKYVEKHKPKENE